MTVAGVTISGNEDEELGEYFDDHEDVGELLDLLVDGAEADEATKAKQKENRPTRRVRSARDFGLACCFRKEASYNTLGSGPQRGRNQSTIRRKGV